MLINLPVKHNNEVIAFFTSDIVRDAKQPVMQAGHKEGYLTKRGKNFGGWKTRYFVLQGPVLEYYDCRGGVHLGSITITGAQIGRQQRTERSSSLDEEKEYRHAFLIVEAKRGPGGSHPRHVLCAESDQDRDSWVEVLVRYFTGTYTEVPVVRLPTRPSAINSTAAYQSGRQGRTSSSGSESPGRRPYRNLKDDISISKGAAVPISQLAQDESNAKLFRSVAPPIVDEHSRAVSPSKMADQWNVQLDAQPSGASSLPDSSPLSASSTDPTAVLVGQRANSELGHYSDLAGNRMATRQGSTREAPGRHRSFHPVLGSVASSPPGTSPIERGPSPDKLDKVKISGPLNGAPIPSGFKFGKEGSSPAEERRLKTRSFWGFGKTHGGERGQVAVPSIPRMVFGVPLEEALDIAQIASLPAIVFRAIQYLETKKADQEEGIYRLSGSSAVIKSLKDRFNTEGDVDLLASDEYWDLHAIAGLLKSFLRELPASILTRDLHLRFLAVIDFVNAQERIRELSLLISALPLANYCLLRALTAHLILIVQNSHVNRMTIRNVGIVFSPTLGIPAGVFSLMLEEFNRVFNVDVGSAGLSGPIGDEDGSSSDLDLDKRNSRQYSDAAADQLLGLAGRSLKAPSEEPLSEGDELSVQEESGTETTDGELGGTSSDCGGGVTGANFVPTFVHGTPPDTPVAMKSTRMADLAATKGLNVAVSGAERGHRHSRIVGLPASPRPPQSPRPPDHTNASAAA